MQMFRIMAAQQCFAVQKDRLLMDLKTEPIPQPSKFNGFSGTEHQCNKSALLKNLVSCSKMANQINAG
jgi:hypothetical protein